jgi:hypothetical protein
MVCSSLCYTLFHDRDERAAGRQAGAARSEPARSGPERGGPERADERPPGRSGPQRPAHPRISPGGVRRRPRRADHRGSQACRRRHQRPVHPLRQQGGTAPHAVHRRPADLRAGDRDRHRASQGGRGPLAGLRRLHAPPDRRRHQLADPRLRRQVRSHAGDVRSGQPVKPAERGAVRPGPRRAQAGPGAARHLAGVRAGGRDQVRRPGAHHRAAAPLPGAHPRRHAGRRP